MLTQPARRPLDALKGILRHASQQRPMPSLFPRTMATETTPTASSSSSSTTTTETPPPPPPPPPAELTPIPIRPKPYLHAKKNRNPEAISRMSFAVYPGLPSARATTPAALEAYHAQQIRRLDPKGLRTALFSRKNRDAVKPGDVLQVTTRRGEPFSGVCMSIRRAGVDTAVLLRNHLTKLGVEMWYKIYSPNVLGIEIVWRRPKRARRARLTYLRHPKHDMGNIDHLVANWRRTRNVFSSRGSKAGKGGAAAAAAAGAGAKGGAKGGKK